MYIDALVNVKLSKWQASKENLCPKEGSFYAYKKVYLKSCFSKRLKPVVLKLYIPKEAIRVIPIYIDDVSKMPLKDLSMIRYKKYRSDRAKAVEVYNLEGKKINKLKLKFSRLLSSYDLTFEYPLGETVYTTLDLDPYHRCSCGINFFMTFEEARDYGLLPNVYF